MALFLRAGFAAGLLLASAVASSARAEDFNLGDLAVQHPWTRATPPGAQVAAGYITIRNNGSTADRLVGGSLEAASGFELHDMSMKDGVMRMRPAAPVEIPPGGSVTLSPSGTHAMFTGLKHVLTKGSAIAGTLVFDHAGTLPVRFSVEAIGAKAPASAAMPGMKMN
ncbi:hypothetical protein SAMN05216548_10264 [Faunimonas pinastri]|uniref:Copper chaperone PCu(A)C n=1 Tax=Faunimonas pinastri TaxID=1855383 RepID=A0A1H9C6C0_9HYPH|nr:copper chaperone PCu(A)C [Faunimonas pinastri]SEP96689.1 hypothetical protein SAMN05216548_10264 [Faunimonas pinastri]